MHHRSTTPLPRRPALLAFALVHACAAGDATTLRDSGAHLPDVAPALDASPDAAALDASPDAAALDASVAITEASVASDARADADAAPPAPVCGNSVCERPTETCTTCPLDCDRCPTCDMAPTCTGALAIPTSSTALADCDNTMAGNERTNYACGTSLGVAPGATTCSDPKLRLRVKEISIRRGWFDIPSNLYCAISTEDGTHSELLLTHPHAVAGNQSTTTYNLALGESVLWGQGDLYRSISNVTITYACFLTSNAGDAMHVLDDIAGRAAMVAAHADGYGWVFGTVAVLGTIIGSSLGTSHDTQVLDVQQTIDARALLALTNGRTWEIHSHHGNIALSGVWDMHLTVESWGCADVRTTIPR